MRRILVGIKRVIDSSTRVRVKPDGSGIALEGVKLCINPFDEIAVEEALRIKERGAADEIIVVSIGPSEVQQQLRTALAMGADRAILITSNTALEPLDVARVLLRLVQREQPFAVLLGKQAIDDDNNQTGQMLAALWDRPQATFASRIELREQTAVVTREVDAGLEVLEVELPAVFTTDLRLNEPRYVKLPNILQAKKKPLETLSLTDLGIEPRVRVPQLRVDAPPLKSRGLRVQTAAELIEALEKKGLI